MEEDIKILNEVLIHYRETKEVRKAIEDLVKAYKEDEAVIEEMAKRIYCDEYRIAKENGNWFEFANSIEVEEYFRNKVKGEKEWV